MQKPSQEIIEKAWADFLRAIHRLSKEQDIVLSTFRKKMTDERLREIRKKLRP